MDYNDEEYAMAMEDLNGVHCECGRVMPDYFLYGEHTCLCGITYTEEKARYNIGEVK